MAFRRPNNATLRNVVEYLESIGLCVYGSHCDLDTKTLYTSGCQDFHAEDVIRYRKIEEAGAWTKADVPMI